MQGEFTGRRMAYLMGSFFAVVVSANLLMAFLASRSWTGLVVKNAYVASQRFDDVTRKLEKSAAMDVHATLSYRAGELRVRLHQASGNPVPARSAALNIGRPSHEGEDRSLPMACGPSGVCAAKTRLAPGIWTGRIDAEMGDGAVWSHHFRIVAGED